MNKVFKYVKENPIWVVLSLVAIALLLSFVSGEASCVLAAVIPTVGGGKIISGEPLTRDLTLRESDERRSDKKRNRRPNNQDTPHVNANRSVVAMGGSEESQFDGGRLLLGRYKTHKGDYEQGIYRAGVGQRHIGSAESYNRHFEQ